MIEAVESTGLAWYWWAAGLWVLGAAVTVVVCGYLDINEPEEIAGFALFWPIVGGFFAALITGVVVASGPWFFGAWIRKKTEGEQP